MQVHNIAYLAIRGAKTILKQVFIYDYTYQKNDNACPSGIEAKFLQLKNFSKN